MDETPCVLARFHNNPYLYCPECGWTAPTCTTTHQGYQCQKPEGHDGQHEHVIRWRHP